MPPHSTHKHAISKDEINALPLRVYSGTIHMIDEDAKMSAAIHALAAEKVLGFDTETRPAFKVGESYPPSLIQLAASDGVYIFQLRHISSHKGLADLLADKNVLKAGIAVRDDINKMRALFPFEPSRFVELADLSAGLGIKNAGLRGLAGLLFGFKISKRSKISRWDAAKLAHEQVVYAATDAWICREIYFALVSMSREKRSPEKHGHAKKGHASQNLFRRQ